MYYTQQNQPMVNPYPNNYNPMLSPQQRLMQMEQQYPQFAQQNQYMMPTQITGATQQPQGIVGKIINDFSELTANDVPMNGSAAFFPKADGSEIQARAWTANGTIQTVVYKPVLDQNQAEGTNIPQTDFNALNDGITALGSSIMARIDKLEESFSNLEINQNSSKAKTAVSRTKKGTDEE